MGDGINNGAGLEVGPSVGTDDGLGLANGLADEPDEGSADGAGMDEEPGVGTENSAGLDEVLLELEARQSEVETLRAELDEGAAGRL